MDDCIALSRIAGYLLERIYRPGHRYKKAGVMLAGLVSGAQRQLTFDTSIDGLERHSRLMKAMDRLNRDWGNETVRLAA